MITGAPVSKIEARCDYRRPSEGEREKYRDESGFYGLLLAITMMIDSFVDVWSCLFILNTPVLNSVSVSTLGL